MGNDVFIRDFNAGKTYQLRFNIDNETVELISTNTSISSVIHKHTNYAIGGTSLNTRNSSSYIPLNLIEYDETERTISSLNRDNIEYYSTTLATANSSEILNSKVAYGPNGKLIGTMPNNGQLTYTPTDTAQNIPSGYTSGGTVAAVDITTLSDYQVCDSIADTLISEQYTPISDYMIYYSKNLTDKSDNHLNGTFGGSYILTDDYVQFSGGYGITGNISRSTGTWEIIGSVNADFMPQSSGNWYNCSCLMGCELGGQQKDFGIIINSNGYVGIGYATSSTSFSNINVLDGNYHHYILTVTNSKLVLYVDNNVAVTVNYSMSGSVPTTYGIYWNNSSSNTAVQGNFKEFKYYNKILTSLEMKLNKILNEKTAKIIPSNIRLGVTILDVAGNLEPDKPDQTKTVTPTTSQQIIEPDTGYELSGVTVNPVTANIDSNILPENIKKDVEILGVIGTHEGGGSVDYNIYIQQTEPENKQGIWINAPTQSYTIQEINSFNTDYNYGANKLLVVRGTDISTQIIDGITYYFYSCVLTDSEGNNKLEYHKYRGTGNSWVEIEDDFAVLTPEEAVESNSILDSILGQSDQGDTDNLTPEEDIIANQIADDILG